MAVVGLRPVLRLTPAGCTKAGLHSDGNRHAAPNHNLIGQAMASHTVPLPLPRMPPNVDTREVARPLTVTMADIDALARRLLSHDALILRASPISSDVRLAALVIKRLRMAYHSSDVITLEM